MSRAPAWTGWVGEGGRAGVSSVGIGRNEDRGGWGDPKEEDGELRAGGNGHSAGGSLEAWVKNSKTSAKSGLSSGFFARHKFTMSQAGCFGTGVHEGGSSFNPSEGQVSMTREFPLPVGIRSESTCWCVKYLMLA